MNAKLIIKWREILLILAGVLVAFYILKLSVENRTRTQGEISNVININTYNANK
jgi:hypothetical protein